MRPETIDRHIQLEITRWLVTGQSGGFRSLLPQMEKRWKIFAKRDNDYRDGYETYGYGDNNRNQMEYISDRWKCAFRLKWIIDGVRDGHI